MTQQFHYWESEKKQNINFKEYMHPVFIAVLFTITKIWKQPNCLTVDECIKKTMVHLHNGVLFSHKKERNLTLCKNSGQTSKVLC